jgi:putative hydrolase of the HAD superfamily
MKLEGVRAILFDVGWTLIYPKPTRKEVTESYLLAQGFLIPSVKFESAYHAAKDYYQIYRWQPEAVQNIAQFWNNFYTRFVEQLGIDDPSLPMRFNQCAKETIQFHLYLETLPVLRELKGRGYLMGVVSNWSSELPDILEKLGLTTYLDVIVVSDLVGFHKPQPEIFRYALSLLGVHPEAIVHIGDDLEADVKGAYHAGIKSLWLDRNSKGDNKLSNRIQSLEEILSIV